MFFFFCKQKTAYEIYYGLVGSEMCIRDRQGAVGARVGDGRVRCAPLERVGVGQPEAGRHRVGGHLADVLADPRRAGGGVGVLCVGGPPRGRRGGSAGLL